MEKPSVPSRREFLKGSVLALGGLTLGLLTRGNIDTRSEGTHADVQAALDDLEVRDSDYEKAIQQVKNSVFKVSGPEAHGSGFLLAPGYILSNRHVVQDNEHRLETDGKFLPLPFPITPPPINIT